MKHILPLTYEPKIPDVRCGKCTQTIRPKSETKPKHQFDLVMFHGWEDRPYRSCWNWRTPYWLIKDVRTNLKITSTQIVSFPDTSLEDILTQEQSDEIARLDGFKDYSEMFQQFKKMYGNKLNDLLFTLIRWEFKES